MPDLPRSDGAPLDVAIVGGGIAGVTLALGLLARNVNVKVYERGRNFREIGAGIGFTANAERAMKTLHPPIHDAFKRVAVQNSNDWFTWVDSYGQDEKSPDNNRRELIHKMYLGERGFEGCHRADFLDELVKMLPEETVGFQKNLDTIEESGDGGKLLLRFHNGTTAEADAVIGCDGIRSRVRQLVLGEDTPAAYPSYSHKFAFRGLVPMDKAIVAMGEDKTSARHMHIGQDAHMLTFPVAGGSLLNVVAFVTDTREWPYKEKLVGPGSKEEAVEAFKGFTPAIRSIIDLLPENPDRWAVFDTLDNPAPTYVKGRVCVSGDAAHASSPHHGAGAGFCIEDAVVLATLLQDVQSELGNPADSSRKRSLIHTALATYDKVRLERTQWLVGTSRFVGELYEWQHGRDPEKMGDEIDSRSRKIWDYDIQQMVRLTEQGFKQSLHGK